MQTIFHKLNVESVWLQLSKTFRHYNLGGFSEDHIFSQNSSRTNNIDRYCMFTVMHVFGKSRKIKFNGYWFQFFYISNVAKACLGAVRNEKQWLCNLNWTPNCSRIWQDLRQITQLNNRRNFFCIPFPLTNIAPSCGGGGGQWLCAYYTQSVSTPTGQQQN